MIRPIAFYMVVFALAIGGLLVMRDVAGERLVAACGSRHALGCEAP